MMLLVFIISASLFHFSFILNTSIVTIKDPQNIELENFTFIDCMHVNFKENKNVAVVKEISRLISKYGEWESVVIDEEGNIIPKL